MNEVLYTVTSALDLAYIDRLEYQTLYQRLTLHHTVKPLIVVSTLFNSFVESNILGSINSSVYAAEGICIDTRQAFWGLWKVANTAMLISLSLMEYNTGISKGWQELRHSPPHTSGCTRDRLTILLSRWVDTLVHEQSMFEGLNHSTVPSLFLWGLQWTLLIAHLLLVIRMSPCQPVVCHKQDKAFITLQVHL